jgi:hypothetical protein
VTALNRRLLCSAAVIATGAALFVADGVVARGPDVGSPYEILSPGFSHGVSWSRGRSGLREARPEGRRVCVRLCDGGFFPIATISGYPSEEAACQGLCPDAPTAVYREMSGSNQIDDAVSSTGETYTALPVAFRYRTTFDATCACHLLASPTYALAQDPTLRKGDYVMTPNGLAVFAGDRDLPHRADDFIAIADAKIPLRDRDALSAMDGFRLRSSVVIAPMPDTNAPHR